MQSSGTGNCVNMLSLIKGGRFPFLTLVSMRGDFGEGNPWQELSPNFGDGLRDQAAAWV